MSLRRMGRNGPAAAAASNVLLLGCEGAGKTLLCRQIERLCSSASERAPPVDARTQPSVGVELLEAVHCKWRLFIREVGGAMQPVWHRYFDGCDAVVLVVDTSSAAVANSGLVEWYGLLSAAALLQKPALLLLNKQDDARALSGPALQHLFRLSDVEASCDGRRLAALPVSGLTGQGLAAALDWLVNELRPTRSGRACRARATSQPALAAASRAS